MVTAAKINQKNNKSVPRNEKKDGLGPKTLLSSVKRLFSKIYLIIVTITVNVPPSQLETLLGRNVKIR